MKGQNMINGLDIERFRTTMAAVENDHAKGKAVLRADSRWVSGTKNEISVRRFPAFTTDEPKNMGGENAAPNPVEYLISAAAGCCSIGFELQAAQAGVKLEQFEISASGGIDMAKLFGMEDGYGGLDNLVLTIKVKADADLPTLQNFADRFADFPVKVASLSRFNNSKATKAALEGMADGTVDIVIGTHKLVQDDIKFKNLGLVIIDEEHRFGVRQKEQLKRLRANVDILTMTATPIPRTLSMALEGLRDFSLITTAPSRRLAVKTFVKPFSEGSVREAVLRELKRGGQVFFLHNEVDTIENMRERLETLLPEARIGVAHGQLRERELEQVMRDFLQQRFNVLLCSTIIETGIDIPNANTIIINRADKFGLAQLHQLRGRVGRSHHQAYAYLLTPEYITKDAEKRLDAIAAADELGAGFTLAMQDLEIRGAGEILGEGQSGEMIQVGFTLYTEMLKQAVRDLKKGRQPDLDAPLGITTEIKLHSPALLPESYCPDIHERLVLYKRLAVCETVQQINAIHEELVDRFGLPEQPVKTLIESHHLRLAAKELGIDAIDATSEAVTVTFGKNNNVDPTEIILLIQKDKKYRLAGADKLRFTAEMENIEVRINTVKNVLKTLKDRVIAK